eukprot:8608336-Lingulodinium_polyedra.AAC.1
MLYRQDIIGRRKQARQRQECPLAGKRAANLAAGEMNEVLRCIVALHIGEVLALVAPRRLTPQERATIIADSEAGKNHILL